MPSLEVFNTVPFSNPHPSISLTSTFYIGCCLSYIYPMACLKSFSSLVAAIPYRFI